jgi:protein O-mannosyl-transferase
MRSQNLQQETEEKDEASHAKANVSWWQNPRWVALIFVVLGFVVFSTGLKSPFIEDDQNQIVNNIPVHSISNIKLFVDGSTFFYGQQNSLAGGLLYRPLMTICFSLLYTLFGPHPFYFHLLQLLLFIGSAFLLYLVFRYPFGPLLSLALALVFLVHPMNSQLVYYIAATQDTLYFFFGILALWLLLRFRSVKSLVLVVGCLFLALLSKESAGLFIAMATVYLFWFDRKRMLPFTGMVAIPVALYLVLRIHAVGLGAPLQSSPIDALNLGQRLMTAPSIILFYLSRMVFPYKLAMKYYWVDKSFTLPHVLLPIMIDVVVVVCVVCLGRLIKARLPKAQFYTYVFFALWASFGIIPYLQIIPLDMTACETWFAFSMVGVLGMINVVLLAFQSRIRPNWFYMIAALLICVLGVRTAFRGVDWHNELSFAYKEVTASPDDFSAYNDVAYGLVQQGDYEHAIEYAKRSVNLYPDTANYTNLGLALARTGDYADALAAYDKGLKYGNDYILYGDKGWLTLVYGSYEANLSFLEKGVQKFPQDPALWMYLAILEQRHGRGDIAKNAIINAEKYGNGRIPQIVYDDIMNNQSFGINSSGQLVNTNSSN